MAKSGDGEEADSKKGWARKMKNSHGLRGIVKQIGWFIIHLKDLDLGFNWIYRF